MDRSSIITLIARHYTQDEIGQQIPTETRRTVYCDLRSVTRSEWAAGGQLGIKPELVAVMFAPEYQGEEIAEIAVSGINEAAYLHDADDQQLTDEEREVLRAAAEAGPTNPGTAIRYGVYRTFRDKGEALELYLERKAGVANG